MEQKQQPAQEASALPRYGFTGVFIPAHIWLSGELTALEKMLLGQLEALSDEGRGCFASNAFLAEGLQITEGGLANMLTRLREKGLIQTFSVEDKRRILVNLDRGNPLHPRMNPYSSTDEPPLHPRMNVYNREKEEGEKDTAPSALVSEVLALWKQLCPSLPEARGISEPRRRAIGARLKEAKGSLEPFREVFQAVEASDFLSGRSGAWKASFDWVLKPANWLKIQEGNYANKKGANLARKLNATDYARHDF